MAKRIDRLEKKKKRPKLGFRSKPKITGINNNKKKNIYIYIYIYIYKRRRLKKEGERRWG